MTDKETNQRAFALLRRLRQEPFNVETERRLESHPFLRAAESGTLTPAQQRAFVREQVAIQLSDAISFARLAGHADFRPLQLAGLEAPSPVRPSAGDGAPDLFQFLLEGEIYASGLLLNYAKALGLKGATAGSRCDLSPLAQAYPSYWARLALSENRAAGAAACAVNFPAWGRMCSRLHTALSEKRYGYNGADDDALSFIKFFSTPIENLDEMAAGIIEEEDATYDDLVTHVRLLQEYEVLFWNAVFAAE